MRRSASELWVGPFASSLVRHEIHGTHTKSQHSYSNSCIGYCDERPFGSFQAFSDHWSRTVFPSQYQPRPDDPLELQVRKHKHGKCGPPV